MRKHFIHLIVETLSIESVKRGVICIEGLSDEDLSTVVDDAQSMIVHLCMLNEEIQRRNDIRKKWKNKRVRPFNPLPKDYWE